MTERDWTGELEDWLRERFAGMCLAAGQRIPLSGFRINPSLGKEEAKYFLLGLEDGLFLLDEAGHVQSELLQAPGAVDPVPYRLFTDDPAAPRLLRENVCQLATASRLILRRGWLKRHVVLAPSSPQHRATAHGVELVVQSADGQILIWTEVKRSAVELQKLIADLQACSSRGPHAHHDCGFPQNHPRYEFCIARRPAYLWAVAPDAEFCFELSYEQGSLGLADLPSLPPRSMLE